MLRFTCGERKVWSKIKKYQNIMTMIIDTKLQLKGEMFEGK